MFQICPAFPIKLLYFENCSFTTDCLMSDGGKIKFCRSQHIRINHPGFPTRGNQPQKGGDANLLFCQFLVPPMLIEPCILKWIKINEFL